MNKNIRLKKYTVLALLISVMITGCAGANDAPAAQVSPKGWESIPVGENNAGKTASAGNTVAAAEEDPAAEAEEKTEAAESTYAEDEEESEASEEESTENESEQEKVVVLPVPEDVAGVYGDELYAFLEERGLHEGNFAVAFKNLETGEYCYFNELKMWDACSTYKLPLNLVYYDMEAEGEISEDDIVPGTEETLKECHRKSLEFSNNELSEAMTDNLGNYYYLKKNICKYFTLSDAEIDPDYYTHNYYCARMMMDCAAYLYAHQSQYEDAWIYLTAAQPGQYLKRKITGVEIAQKYGKRDELEHCAGVVTGEHPFVLAVYTEHAGGEELIASTAALFYDLVNRS